MRHIQKEEPADGVGRIRKEKSSSAQCFVSMGIEIDGGEHFNCWQWRNYWKGTQMAVNKEGI